MDALVASKEPVNKKPKMEDEDKFLAEMRKRYDFGVDFDQFNMIAAQEDAEFVVGNQWDPQVAQRRRDRHAPVLTFNRLPAVVGQIIGARLMNETEIRIYPDKGGTKEVAEIREGLIRNIVKNSQADLARNEAQKYQIIGGRGVYYLSVDYAGDDVFDQEINIRPCSDPYSAVFDPLGIDPTGADCEWAFITDDMPKETFKARWPDAAEVSWDKLPPSSWNGQPYWYDGDTIRVVNYWQMVTEGTKKLALLADGAMRDVTDLSEDQYPFLDVPIVRVREVPNRFARMYVCSGSAVLEGPYDYPVSSIPVFRVSGWEVKTGDRLNRWGVVRDLKDPQRLHNFWRSVIAERLVAAPRNKFLVTKASIQGYEEEWRSAGVNPDPFLHYNEDQLKPEPVQPPLPDTAVLEQAAATTQDIKDISNIHEAALGMPSNEVSGKAIQQRQFVSDIGTYVYVDRDRLAFERCAKLINELIPYIYDTERTIVILGRDNKHLLVAINSGQNNDLGLGRYGITVTTGPATATKRQLASEQMLTFVNAAPDAAANFMDLIAEAQDWPKAAEFARRFRMMLPPNMIPPDELTPEMIQQQQQAAQAAAMEAEMAMAQQKAEIAKTESEAANNRARANLAEAQSIQAIADAKARLADVESKVNEREIKAALNLTDQHARIEEEDRRFAAERDDANKPEKSE
jgi:hypothetical protein